MKKSIKQLIVGVSVAVMAFTGLAVFSPASSSSILGTQKASAATCYSQWRVIWTELGVYAEPTGNSRIIHRYHYGEILYTNAGQQYSGWRHHVTRGYVRDAGLQYLGTYCL